MACLPTWLKEKYTADLARVRAQITAIEVEIESAYSNAEIDEYSFNSNEGSQKTKRRSIKELNSVLENLESKEMRILRKLNGTSLVNMTTRRKRY